VAIVEKGLRVFGVILAADSHHALSDEGVILGVGLVEPIQVVFHHLVGALRPPDRGHAVLGQPIAVFLGINS
jgi:hypothetical protein